MTAVSEMTAYGLYSVVVLAIGFGFWLPMFLRKHIQENPPNTIQRGMWGLVFILVWGIPAVCALASFFPKMVN